MFLLCNIVNYKYLSKGEQSSTNVKCVPSVKRFKDLNPPSSYRTLEKSYRNLRLYDTCLVYRYMICSQFEET